LCNFTSGSIIVFHFSLHRGRALLPSPPFIMDYLTEKYKFKHRLEGLVQGLSDEIAGVLEGALSTVSGTIIALEAKAKQTDSIYRRRNYLKHQRQEIQKVLNSVYKEIGHKIEIQAFEVAKATPKIEDSIIKKSLGGIVKIKTTMPSLDVKLIKGWFQSTQIEGLWFNDYLAKLKNGAAKRIIKEVRESLVLNEGTRQTAKRIQHALKIGRRGATGLAHNALTQAHSWAEHRYHMANRAIFKSVRFVAELDRRTSPLCRSLDGKIFPVNEAPILPLHYFCRSMLSVVFKNDKLNKIAGTKIARIETQGRTVHHRDGTTSTRYEKLRVQHPSDKITYNGWMSSMVNSKNPVDVAFAKEALGPTRFNLIKSGKLKMEALYYHGKLKTIKELMRLMK